MKKYSDGLINKYINGENISDYSIDELENDKSFMLQVIKTSRNKRFYNLCSESVKRDYELVKNLVLVFRNDLDFIIKVADNYLDNADDSLERTELALVMFDITRKKDKEKSEKYKILTDAIFVRRRLEVEICKANENDDEFSADIGMGFLYMFDLYNSSDIVTKFFARKIIDNIFSEYDINIERLLHSRFKSVDDIKQVGINNYMINFIRMYDEMLSSYVSTHIELLSAFSDKILKVINNWEKYDNQKERKIYNDMIERVHEYMENTNSLLTETDILYYVARKMGIVKKLAYYDGMTDEKFELIENELIGSDNDDFVTSTVNSFIDERRVYVNVKEIMLNSLFSDKASNDLKSKNLKSNEQNKCKILKLGFGEKKNSE